MITKTTTEDFRSKCYNCGTHGYFGGVQPCFACASSLVHIADAIDMRLGPVPTYHYAAFRDFKGYPQSAILLRFRAVLQSTIIKVREQVQQALKEAEYEKVALTEGMRTSLVTSSLSKVKLHYLKKKRIIFDQLSTACQQSCLWCGDKIKETEFNFDTIIPSGLSHYNDPIAIPYYQMMSNIGNLALTCPKCNFVKGRVEGNGIHVLKSWASGHLVASKQDRNKQVQNQEFSLPLNGRHFAEWIRQPQERAVAPPVPPDAILENVVRCCVRFTRRCKCPNSPLKVAYNQIERTVEFACTNCVKDRNLMIVRGVTLRWKSQQQVETSQHEEPKQDTEANGPFAIERG